MLLNTSTRFRHLGLALSIFYLLYNVTTFYSVSLYKFYPSSVYNLATPFDSVIPFIPAMIVPYSWSLILFVGSFFLVRTSIQLSLLTYRLILATVFACFIFYFYPARFSFHRPIPDNWTQFGYQLLQVVDKPFNQLPSLHVSYAILLCVSLWDVVESKQRWVLILYRLLLVAICTSIACSTVLTYQHHLLDMFGGVVLAISVLMLSNRIRNALVVKHLAIGGTGFLLIAIAGFYLANMSMIAADMIETFAITIALYWLISFVMLACAYQQVRPMQDIRWFQKSGSGRLTAYTWMKFAPIIMIYNAMLLLGQWYFNVFSKGQKYPITPYAMSDSVAVVASPRLTQKSINTHLTDWLRLPKEDKSLVCSQIIVVDLAAEISSHVDKLEMTAKDITSASIDYLYLPLLDLQPLSDVVFQDYIDLFERIDALIQSAKTRASTNDNKVERCVITLINFHCVMGLSRSIGVQVLYLLYCGTLTLHNYQSWLEQYYPHAHLKDAYLPQSLVEVMTHYKSIKYSKRPL